MRNAIIAFAFLCVSQLSVLGADDLQPPKASVQAVPDDILPKGHEHMLPHYGILDIGGATLTTSEEKLLLFVNPTLYVDGKVEQQFGNYPVLLERGNKVQLSMSMKSLGVEWDDRFGNNGPLYYVATGYDENRQTKTFHARGRVDWPKTSGNIHRIEEVPLPGEVALPYGEPTAIWAWIGEGVESIDELSTPRSERGEPMKRAEQAEWAFVLLVTAKAPAEED